MATMNPRIYIAGRPCQGREVADHLRVARPRYPWLVVGPGRDTHPVGRPRVKRRSHVDHGAGHSSSGDRQGFPGARGCRAAQDPRRKTQPTLDVAVGLVGLASHHAHESDQANHHRLAWPGAMTPATRDYCSPLPRMGKSPCDRSAVKPDAIAQAKCSGGERENLCWVEWDYTTTRITCSTVCSRSSAGRARMSTRFNSDA